MELNIAPYLAIITAIVAAYFTYRNQQRLKSFEILYDRKTSVLADMEAYLKNLHLLRSEIEKDELSDVLEKYLREHFHEGLVLYHKVKGANFGGISEVMAETFWSIVKETSTKGAMTKEDAKEWIHRTTNALSALYGFSHSQLTKDLEEMAFSYTARFIRKRKREVKVEKKVNK
ncbi:hypothetical protein [Thalassolituus hydrocarboniclasticus]|uniref:DUF4760 domain-containing protein n=1 Tax=Thalassolituus hydrocarboniclasticus TaxID=2742796 RepID=A0ABY6A7W5_9GAMM|nr:hypothetical protein [Thalassolituus hydrocarboniclasticus]UXD86336.1 hypothetical protein HUF19_02220 [Thalassolituus hydrocarboniclasticus]